VTKLLKIEHYDEVAEALRPASGGNPVSADAMGKFPSEFIPKTDEERIQNLGDYFEKMKGRAFEVTEKNDGSSVTVFLSTEVDPENPFGVCSRNLRLKPKMESGATPVPWQVAEKYGLREKLAKANAMTHTELAFQGELVGPGVNGNRDLYTEFEWHVFRIWDIKNQWFLMPGHAQDLCEDLGIPYVPVISKFMKVFDEITSMDELLKFAEGKTARGHEREGLVFKSADDKPFVSFKAVSNRYLLKGG
jgi:RNA ligase (TIGR02306 family)